MIALTCRGPPVSSFKKIYIFLFRVCVCVRVQSSVSGIKVQSGGNISVENQWNLDVLLAVPERFLSTQLRCIRVLANYGRDA